MRTQNWIPGIIISVGVSLVAALPRMIRAETIDISTALISILYNFLFCMSCWLIYQYIFSRTRLQKPHRGYFLLTPLIIFAVGCITFLYDALLPGVAGSATTAPVLFPEITGSKRTFILLLRSSVISCLFYFISYYLHMMAEKQQALLEVAQLKQAQLSANLSSLKEQLSPHFLFNTLNTLSSLTKEASVKNYVAELASVYRYVLQYQEMDSATLQQELSFIQSYLYIVKTRLEEAIEVNIDVDQAVLSSRIPPLTLQLLIENAIKHNVASTTRQLKISIKNQGGRFLVISNNYQTKTSVQLSAGIGLGNVMQRYLLLFNKEIEIERTEAFFVVKLPIV